MTAGLTETQIAPPQDVRRPRQGRRTAAALIAGVVAFVLLPRAGLSSNAMNLLDLWLAYSIAAIGYFWVLGLGGRYAFCHTFMMALGGYTCAWVDRQGGGFLLALLVAVCAVGLAALAVGALMWRVEQFYFAIGTLAVSEVAFTLFARSSDFTGTNGNVYGISYPSILGIELDSDEQIYYLFLGVVVCLIVLSLLLTTAPVGRDLQAARELPMVARSCGIPVRRLELALFTLGSAVGGLAGALITFWSGFIGVDSFGLDLAVGMLLMVILGGIRSPFGAMLGAAFYVFLPEAFSGASNYMPIVYGAALLITIMVVPKGLTHAVASLPRALARPRERWASPGAGA